MVTLSAFFIYKRKARIIELSSFSFEPYIRTPRKPASYTDHLEEYAKIVEQPNGPPLKFIILAMTDRAFVDMAVNLYLSSFKRFDIGNYLFVGAGLEACHELIALHINCIHYTDDPDSDVANFFGTRSFICKMNIRTDMILNALTAGYTVLHMDLDVIFLKNPLPYIEKCMQTNDMAALLDFYVHNAGFLAIKPTNFSIDVYTEVQRKANKSISLDDQNALNQAISKIQKHKKNESNVLTLDTNKFVCGLVYFEEKKGDFPGRNGSDSCPECIVMHNNWIVSREAKILRFKERNMWWVDKDAYYSDERRKYLIYDNPVLEKPSFIVSEKEREALISGLALAQILNRALIIPRFHCNQSQPTKECPLNSWLKITAFDNQFAGSYRESSFLHSPLVPSNIRVSLSNECVNRTFSKTTNKLCSAKKDGNINRCSNMLPTPFVIQTKETLSLNIFHSLEEANILTFATLDSLDDELIIKTFGHCEDPVLHLASLLAVKVTFSNKNDSISFYDKVMKGFRRSDYRQYEN